MQRLDADSAVGAQIFACLHRICCCEGIPVEHIVYKSPLGIARFLAKYSSPEAQDLSKMIRHHPSPEQPTRIAQLLAEIEDGSAAVTANPSRSLNDKPKARQHQDSSIRRVTL